MKKCRKILVALCLVVFAALTTVGVYRVKAETSDTILDGVYVGGVNVGGMTKEEAKEAIDAYVDDIMQTTFTLTGESGSIEVTAEDMGVTSDTDAAIEEALGVGRTGNLVSRYKIVEDLKTTNYVTDMHLHVDKQATATLLYDSKSVLDIKAEDNGLTVENGVFTFVPGCEGIEVNIVDSVLLIDEFLSKEWDGSNNEIALVTEKILPRGSEEELAEVKDLLGTFYTSFSYSDPNRAQNVINGCNIINGTILYPGEEFSVSDTVGPFTPENGYAPAGTYENGKTVNSYGGGICQVSSTLYNAAIRAELEIVERFNHSMLVGYVDPSADAAIAGDYKDLKFKNNLDYPIFIEGIIDGGKFTFNIYGKETREAGRSVDFFSEVLSTEEPEPEYHLNAELPVGSYVKEQGAHTAMSARLWKTVYIDGVEQSREIFNESRYVSSPLIAQIGIGGANEAQLAAINAAIESKNDETVQGTCGSIGEVAPPATETPVEQPVTPPVDPNAGSGAETNPPATDPVTPPATDPATPPATNPGTTEGATNPTP